MEIGRRKKGFFLILLYYFLTTFLYLTKADIIQTMETKRNVIDEEGYLPLGSNESFTSMLKRNSYARSLTRGELTIFAPSDDAIRKYKGQKDIQFILNHLVNVVVKLGETNKEDSLIAMNSLSPGSSPLYIIRNGIDYYINGAKIIMRNLKPNNGNQILHIVDSVLEPLVPIKSVGYKDSGIMVGLTAGKLLRNSKRFNLNGHSISEFYERVKGLNELTIFDRAGQNTFFIPINQAFKNISIYLLTSDILKGHIVPDHLLFTNPIVGKEEKTLTFQSKKGILISAFIQSSRQGAQVKSLTVRGNLENPRGEHVIANIVHANIPVANGVVHLIDRPLVIVASSLWKYMLNERHGKRLSRFAKHLQRYGGGLEDIIKNCGEGTLFVPSDDAFTPEIEDLLQDKEKATQILALHFVDKRIAGDDIRVRRPQNGLDMYNAALPYPPKNNNKLWFYFKNNETLFINGLGVSAEVIQPDIGATNGVIHIIDKVLGVPSQTIYDQLSTDPMLSSTYSLSAQDHFNKDFKDESMKFTFLAPSNRAWNDVQHNFASAHKQLFMGRFAYQSRTMLEKHLKIGQALTVENLLDISAKKGTVQMLRGVPIQVFSQKDDNNEEAIYVEWESLRAKIIRPNLNCTNGYIHVLDRVMMKRRDVTLGIPSSGKINTLYNLPFIILLQFIIIRIYFK